MIHPSAAARMLDLAIKHPQLFTSKSEVRMPAGLVPGSDGWKAWEPYYSTLQAASIDGSASSHIVRPWFVALFEPALLCSKVDSAGGCHLD